jgi:hypothetical protein
VSLGNLFDGHAKELKGNVGVLGDTSAFQI